MLGEALHMRYAGCAPGWRVIAFLMDGKAKGRSGERFVWSGRVQDANGEFAGPARAHECLHAATHA
eukprot:6186185-Pleurochrysis_carterae.AAC.3